MNRRHPGEPKPLPAHLAGLLTVDVGDTLEDVEESLCIRRNGGRRRPYDSASGRALDDDTTMETR